MITKQPRNTSKKVTVNCFNYQLLEECQGKKSRLQVIPYDFFPEMPAAYQEGIIDYFVEFKILWNFHMLA